MLQALRFAMRRSLSICFSSYFSAYLALGLTLCFSEFALSSPRANTAIQQNTRWIGWAYWDFDNSSTRCNAQMSFHDDSNQFSRLGGSIDCTVVFMEVPSVTLQKSEGNLLLDGQVVGTWQPNAYQWQEIYNENVRIEISVLFDGGHMDYIEKWIEKDNSVLYEIKARLFKSSSFKNYLE